MSYICVKSVDKSQRSHTLQLLHRESASMSIGALYNILIINDDNEDDYDDNDDDDDDHRHGEGGED